MADSSLQHYLRHHRRYELAAWTALFTANTLANVIVQLMDGGRFGGSAAAWEVVSWELSSTVMIALLLPVLIRFDDRFPLRLDTLPGHLLAHLAFTLPWSLAHVAGMVALRKLVYAAAGSYYDFGPVLSEFAYEYLKDFRSYATLLSVIYLYRFILLRLQGEARFLGEGENDDEDGAEDGAQARASGRSRSPATLPVTDRFLVKKLGREFLVRVDDIEWVESAGNYVNLHVGRRLYPLRETMNNIEQRLQGAGFARVHRSAIVKLDRIDQIEPFESGDARAHLDSGVQVPVSRRYRAALRAGLG